MYQFLNQRQINANRRNAKKSTGPTSAEGKAAVARNAVKFGIYAKSILVDGEIKEDFDALSADYHRELQPASLEARSLVNELVLCEWRLRRFAVIEAELLYDCCAPASNRLGYVFNNRNKSFSALQRQIDATRRARDRAFQRLREIQPPAPPETTDPATRDNGRPLVSAPEPTPSTPITYPPNWVCSADSPSVPLLVSTAAPNHAPVPSGVAS